jgi:hypothetical protein
LFAVSGPLALQSSHARGHACNAAQGDSTCSCSCSCCSSSCSCSRCSCSCCRRRGSNCKRCDEMARECHTASQLKLNDARYLEPFLLPNLLLALPDEISRQNFLDKSVECETISVKVAIQFGYVNRLPPPPPPPPPQQQQQQPLQTTTASNKKCTLHSSHNSRPRREDTCRTPRMSIRRPKDETGKGFRFGVRKHFELRTSREKRGKNSQVQTWEWLEW